MLLISRCCLIASEAADGTAVCSVASTKTSLLNGSKFSDKITSQVSIVWLRYSDILQCSRIVSIQ